jgi:hypothetical protein
MIDQKFIRPADNGIHVASDGLDPEEVREALCTAIHAAFLFNEGG